MEKSENLTTYTYKIEQKPKYEKIDVHDDVKNLLFDVVRNPKSKKCSET